MILAQCKNMWILIRFLLIPSFFMVLAHQHCVLKMCLNFVFFHFCLPKPIPARGIRIESTPRASSAFKILVQKIFQYAMEHLKNADIGRKRTNMHHIPME